MSAYVANPEYGTIIHPVKQPAITKRVAAQMEADGYMVKDEFHITVIDSEYGQSLPPVDFKELADFFSAVPPARFSYIGSLFEVEKPKVVEGRAYPRRSLVAPIASMAMFRTLYDARVAMQLALPHPFLHVTLATHPDTPVARRGIGIASEEEWTRLGPILYEMDWEA